MLKTNPMATRIFLCTLAALHHRTFARVSRLFSSCPFQVLGLKNKGTAYVQVQAAFRELALKHHPDVSGDEKSTKQFIRIKDAFHSIEEGPSGIAVLRDDNHCKDQLSSDEKEFDVQCNGVDVEFIADPWDKHNGLLHPSVNPQILHEIADMAEKMNPGGLDRGGMWQYANMISNREKSMGVMVYLHYDLRAGMIQLSKEATRGVERGEGVNEIRFYFITD